jgi:recombinational DNA repair ATPase RecF
MSITSLQIVGLRSFAETQTLNLSLPDGQLGGGLTMLVGPNNGGKSTIIEAFSAMTQPRDVSFTEGKRNKTAGDKVRIQASSSSGESKTLRTVDTGGSESKWENKDGQPEASSIFVLQSRRTFNPFFGKGFRRAPAIRRDMSYLLYGHPQSTIFRRGYFKYKKTELGLI